MMGTFHAKWLLGVLMAGFFALGGCSRGAANGAGPDSSTKELNPLLAQWDTPFGVPPFERIKEDHYLPAFQETIARTRQEVEAIAKDERPATFANTIEALDASGESLDRVESVFHNLRSADTNEAAPGDRPAGGPAHFGAAGRYSAQRAAFRPREGRLGAAQMRSGSTPSSAGSWRRPTRDFVRGGANLSAESKTRLRADQ